MKKKHLILIMVLCTIIHLVQTSCTPEKLPSVQAHRGGAAIYPENTISAMIHAASIGIPILEMDMQVTRDSQVVVSHDAYLNASKILKPDGSKIPADSDKFYAIYKMTYDSLKRYDAGLHPNPDFPNRKNVRCPIPRISDLIDSVESYTKHKGIPPMQYNIEIKSSPEKDGIYTPDYKTFADLCIKELLRKKLGSRLLVQCFDPRTLNYVHEAYPDIRLSYLVEGKGIDFSSFMAQLNFTPQVISPDHKIVNDDFVEKAHRKKMSVIPWTVDDKKEVLRLKKLGVDEIISNQPDSVVLWLKE